MGKVQGMSQGRQFGQRRAGVCARFPQVQEQHAETSKEKKHVSFLPQPTVGSVPIALMSVDTAMLLWLALALLCSLPVHP